MKSLARRLLVPAAAVASLASAASASFHIMQIEKIMLGYDGDPTVQAVQLRMRSSFQNQVQFSRIVARNATGGGAIVVCDMNAPVSGTALGARVLIATSNFAGKTTPAAAPNFTITNLVPSSYLAGGRLTFEDDFGTIYWSVSWGSYTGSQTGSITNDSDGNFGPGVAGAFPITGTTALKFTGSASAASTTNAANYAYETSNVVFTNNAGTNFTVNTPPPPPPPCFADYNQDGGIDGADVEAFFRDWEAGASGADVNQDGGVDGGDVGRFFEAWEAQHC
ncbi:MAG: hypothetical protein JSR77_11225 [Planctomycetes bacterium]|nr:hypothetical protein [Planctomycetota bacterium]